MTQKKNNLKNLKAPTASYEKMKVAFFNSFEDEGDYVAKQRARTSFEKRLKDIEQLRKSVFHNHLMPDNTWKPIARIFKIMTPYTNDDSQ